MPSATPFSYTAVHTPMSLLTRLMPVGVGGRGEGEWPTPPPLTFLLRSLRAVPSSRESSFLFSVLPLLRLRDRVPELSWRGVEGLAEEAPRFGERLMANLTTFQILLSQSLCVVEFLSGILLSGCFSILGYPGVLTSPVTSK